MTNVAGLVVSLGQLAVQVYRTFSESSDLALRAPVLHEQLRTQCVDFELWQESLGADADLENWLQRRGVLVRQEILRHQTLIILKLWNLKVLAKTYGMVLVGEEDPEPSGAVSRSGFGIRSAFKLGKSAATTNSTNRIYEKILELFPKQEQDQVSKDMEALEKLQRNTYEALPMLKKLRFALSDESKFKLLLEEVKMLVDGLKGLYSHFERDNQKRLLARRIRETRETPESLQNLEQGSQGYPSLFRAAQRTNSRIIYEESESSGNLQSSPYLSEVDLKLDVKNLVYVKSNSSRNRDIGTYAGNRDVIVEWKTYEDDNARKICKARIRDLARFLHDTSRNREDFEVLDCIGYLDDTSARQGQSRMGLVFLRPPTLRAESLLQVLELSGDFLEGPNLEYRFLLAKCLVNICFYLHISGWLHKSICSDNIILKADDKSPLFLMGLDFSRPHHMLQASESLQSNQQMDRYRHPEVRGQHGPQRPRYKKGYDLFSLGIVLIEIAYWSPIAKLSPMPQSGQVVVKHLVDEITKPLGFMMGKGYQEAVRACVSGVFDDEETNDMFLEKVVSQLDRCSV